MCGIAGLFNRHLPADRTALELAVSRLHHRGPDDRGFFIAGSVGLGHSRLSIIDLTGGHQPMGTRDQGLTLIANGELYNFVELRKTLESLGHRFLTHSDCEVLLHAYREYGDRFLELIHGMFAFALHDASCDRLILARDRLGIKPLFIAESNQGVAFASEIKGLLPLLQKSPPPLDAEGLAQYFQNQYATGRTTVLRGIEKLLPGEMIWIEQGRITRRERYWSPEHVTIRDIDETEALREFDELMAQVMTEHQRSDVPFGLFLSGGVDSSILLAQLSRNSDQPVHTYSVGFPGTRLKDELPLAQRVARRFGSRHREIRPDSQAIFHSLPLAVWAADELMRDHANLPTILLAQAASQELKVVFSGEGGDEVFAGYGRYRPSPVERWFKRLRSPGSGGFRTRGTFRGRWMERLFTPPFLEALAAARQPVVTAWQRSPGAWSNLQRMQAIDLTQALPDNLLVKADRMLMAWGLEGRVPLLDHRIVEFGLSLPDRLKVSGKQGKLFLKRWASRDLPEDLLYARKRGFHVPVEEWLGGDFLAALARDLPEDPALKPWFRPEGVRELIAHCQGNSRGSSMLWAIVQFAIWSRLLQQEFAQRPEPLTDPLELMRNSRSPLS